MQQGGNDIKGELKYLTQNCITAFNELKRLNKSLHWARDLKFDSNIDINQIETLHRIVQDYIIVKVAALFDPKTYTASYENEFKKNKEYGNIKKANIIKYIIIMRHAFVSHNHKEKPKGHPQTYIILESNLPNLLNQLISLLKI